MTGGSAFEGGGIRIDLPGVTLPDRDVVLGLRPQALLGRLGDIAGPSLGVADIVAVEHHGPESFATARLLGTTPLTISIAPGDDIQPGTRVSIGVDLSAPHFFDPSSGRRLATA